MNYWQRVINILAWFAIVVAGSVIMIDGLHWPAWVCILLSIIVASSVVEYLDS